MKYNNVPEIEKSCSPNFSLVVTKSGLMNVGQIRPNIPVLTKTGTFKSVNRRTSYKEQPIYDIEISNFFTYSTFKNKLICVKTENLDGSFTEPYMKQAYDLGRADHICMPIERKETYKEYDEKFLLSLGIFCALGKTVINKQGKTERQIIFPKKKEIEIPFETEDISEPNGRLRKLKATDEDILQPIISNIYFDGVKHIPMFLINSSIENIKTFLKGYFILNNGEIPETCTVVTKESAEVLFFLLCKVTEKLCKVECFYDKFIISLSGGNEFAFYEDGCFWIPIERAKNAFRTATVSEISVDTDFSYISDLILGK